MFEEHLTVAELTDLSAWQGGWYQPIEFPNGEKTASTKWNDFFERDDFGERKWRRMIEPHLIKGDKFLEIGCNAGLYLVLAKKFGYKNVIGIESFDYFYRQCKYVINRFGCDAEVFLSDALSFEYDRLKSVDVVLMANTLYWIGYKDSGKFIPDYDVKLDKFIKRLAFLTNRIIIVGGEKVDRVGGKLSITLPLIEKYFNVKTTEVIDTHHRLLNLIVADTKVKEDMIEIDLLLKELEGRGDYAVEFIQSFGEFVDGYFKHKKWMKTHGGLFRGKDMDDMRIQNLCFNWLNLAKSIEQNGLLSPIEVFKEDGHTQIDGWHRLVILKALGYKTVTYKKVNDNVDKGI